jgi:hypothetical protein
MPLAAIVFGQLRIRVSSSPESRRMKVRKLLPNCAVLDLAVFCLGEGQ